MGFKKNMKKARHLGKKSVKAVNHVGKKVVKQGPEFLVKSGQTFQDIGKIGERVGEGLMFVDPEIGQMVLDGSRSLEEIGTVTKTAGRSAKKIRKGDLEGGMDAIDDAFFFERTGQRETYKKNPRYKKNGMEKTIDYTPEYTSNVPVNYQRVTNNSNIESVSSSSSSKPVKTMESRNSYQKFA